METYFQTHLIRNKHNDVGNKFLAGDVLYFINNDGTRLSGDYTVVSFLREFGDTAYLVSGSSGKQYVLKYVVKGVLPEVSKTYDECDGFVSCAKAVYSRGGKWSDEQHAFYIFPFVPGTQDLFHFIQTNQTKSWDRQIQLLLAYTLLDALARVHDKGVTLRDIKPETILISQDMRSVGFLNLGSVCGSEDTRCLNVKVGTPGYWSNRVMNPQSPSLTFEEWKEADVWSMGWVLYAIIQQRPPPWSRTEKDGVNQFEYKSFQKYESVYLPVLMKRKNVLYHLIAGMVNHQKQITALEAKTTVEGLLRSPPPPAIPLNDGGGSVDWCVIA